MIGGLEMGIKDDCRNAHSRQSSGVVCSTCLGHGCPHDSAARRGSCRPRRRHKARQGPSQRPAASTRWSACGAVGRLEGSGEVHSSISVSTPCRQARNTGAVSDEPPPAPGGHMGWVVAPCFCQASRQAWHGMDPCAQHCPPGWLPTPVPMAHLGAVSRHARQAPLPPLAGQLLGGQLDEQHTKTEQVNSHRAPLPRCQLLRSSIHLTLACRGCTGGPSCGSAAARAN